MTPIIPMDAGTHKEFAFAQGFAANASLRILDDPSDFSSGPYGPTPTAQNDRPAVVCTVPSSWPLLPGTLAMAEVWLTQCDRLVFGVPRAQLGVESVSLGHQASIQATHEGSNASRRICPSCGNWPPVAFAVRYVATNNMSGMDFMLLTETDAFVRFGRVRAFLSSIVRKRPPSQALFYGDCRDSRARGVSIFSRGALQTLLKIRLPPRTAGDPNRSYFDQCTGDGVHGSSDSSVVMCIQQAGMSCQQPRDHLNLHLFALQAQGSWTAGDFLLNLTRSKPFCYFGQERCSVAYRDAAAAARLSRKATPLEYMCCNSPDTFGFHPVKQPMIQHKLFLAFRTVDGAPGLVGGSALLSALQRAMTAAGRNPAESGSRRENYSIVAWVGDTVRRLTGSFYVKSRL